MTQIQQNDRGVTVSYVDTANPSAVLHAKADWCICTIPLSILSQIPIDVGSRMEAAIDAVSYAGAVKIGLQFKRRFWEEDEAIYGGISYTDLPIRQIAYPNEGFNRTGRGVLLGAYLFEGANAYEFTAMAPAERIANAVEFGSMIHPQYKQEFENGVCGRLAPGALHPRLQRRMDRRGQGEGTTRICARSTDGSCWPASTHPVCRPGRRGDPVLARRHRAIARTGGEKREADKSPSQSRKGGRRAARAPPCGHRALRRTTPPRAPPSARATASSK